jgi:hypothetical protein
MTPSLEAKRKFIKSLRADGYQVKTDTGWSDIQYCHKTIEYGIWELTTTRHALRCADTHIVFRSNASGDVLDEVFVKDLCPGDYISTEDGYDIVTNVECTEQSANMYDLELTDTNHRYYTSGILSHNSSTTRGYILWYAMFQEDKNVAIMANKLKLAKEQLLELRNSYLSLPYWLQIGVLEWNKESIVFANNTRIGCFSTSPDGIRGMSINLLYLDEFAFVRTHIADEFMASVFPTISSGNTTKVIITSTPNGMNQFYDMWQLAAYEDAYDPDDKAQNGYVRSEIEWNEVPGRDGEWMARELARIGEIRFNQEYKCQFVGSVSTLVDHKVLLELQNKIRGPMPIRGLGEEISIWEPPRARSEMDHYGWEYAASLDCGYGVHKDATVLQICLVKSNITIYQVAKMSSNKMEIDQFCAIANRLLQKYHSPALIIEQNGPGIAATKFFYSTAEYESLMHFDPKGRMMGLWASETLKQTAIILLKTYIQRGFLKIFDKKTIEELMSFGQITRTKWGGKGGTNDDHITSIYWIPYYVNSPLFYGNVTEANIRGLNKGERLEMSEEEMAILTQLTDYTKSLDMLTTAADSAAVGEARKEAGDGVDSDDEEDDDDDEPSSGTKIIRHR